MDPHTITMLYIFFARIFDVSIGTMRIILIARGYKSIAPVLGFAEILIWLTAISKALNNLQGVESYLIYAAGFAAGNYVGMMIEELIPIGFQSIRVITKVKATEIIEVFRQKDINLAILSGENMEGEVSILYTVLPKKEIKWALETIRKYHPPAFITVEDVRSYHAGYLAKKRSVFSRLALNKK